MQAVGTCKHTYYVIAGNTPVLVHNTPGCGPGVRSLGHYRDYVDLAEKTGAQHFSVPDDVWNAMTPEWQWAANQKFLDRGIANGDTFLLATPIDKMRPDSWSPIQNSLWCEGLSHMGVTMRNGGRP